MKIEYNKAQDSNASFYAKHGRWYVFANPGYLLKNGTIYPNAGGPGGWDGYYKTRALARAAVKAYKAKDLTWADLKPGDKFSFEFDGGPNSNWIYVKLVSNYCIVIAKPDCVGDNVFTRVNLYDQADCIVYRR